MLLESFRFSAATNREDGKFVYPQLGDHLEPLYDKVGVARDAVLVDETLLREGSMAGVCVAMILHVVVFLMVLRTLAECSSAGPLTFPCIADNRDVDGSVLEMCRRASDGSSFATTAR